MALSLTVEEANKLAKYFEFIFKKTPVGVELTSKLSSTTTDITLDDTETSLCWKKMEHSKKHNGSALTEKVRISQTVIPELKEVVRKPRVPKEA